MLEGGRKLGWKGKEEERIDGREEIAIWEERNECRGEGGGKGSTDGGEVTEGSAIEDL